MARRSGRSRRRAARRRVRRSGRASAPRPPPRRGRRGARRPAAGRRPRQPLQGRGPGPHRPVEAPVDPRGVEAGRTVAGQEAPGAQLIGRRRLVHHRLGAPRHAGAGRGGAPEEVVVLAARPAVGARNSGVPSRSTSLRAISRFWAPFSAATRPVAARRRPAKRLLRASRPAPAGSSASTGPPDQMGAEALAAGDEWCEPARRHAAVVVEHRQPPPARRDPAGLATSALRTAASPRSGTGR